MISYLSGQVSSADIMITLIQHLTDVINTSFNISQVLNQGVIVMSALNLLVKCRVFR